MRGDGQEMKHIKAKILENKKISQHHHRIRVDSGYLAKAIKPGQFIEIRCSDGTDPLLRRPLSVHKISKNWIEVLFEVVGKGTGLLAEKRQGETLDIIGPLGNGFTLPAMLSDPILIAGGIGVAPLAALAEELGSGVMGQGSKEKIRPIIMIGAKTKSHILCEKEFKELGCKVFIATEDGSKGHKGFITDTLKEFFRTTNEERRMSLYACGPTGMLKAVSAIAEEHSVPCQVSLEEHMACGVGVCLGCPVKVRKDLVDYEYKMVCKDGPVFASEQIIW